MTHDHDHPITSNRVDRVEHRLTSVRHTRQALERERAHLNSMLGSPEGRWRAVRTSHFARLGLALSGGLLFFMAGWMAQGLIMQWPWFMLTAACMMAAWLEHRAWRHKPRSYQEARMHAQARLRALEHKDEKLREEERELGLRHDQLKARGASGQLTQVLELQGGVTLQSHAAHDVEAHTATSPPHALSPREVLTPQETVDIRAELMRHPTLWKLGTPGGILIVSASLLSATVFMGLALRALGASVANWIPILYMMCAVGLLSAAWRVSKRIVYTKSPSHRSRRARLEALLELEAHDPLMSVSLHEDIEWMD